MLNLLTAVPKNLKTPSMRAFTGPHRVEKVVKEALKTFTLLPDTGKTRSMSSTMPS